MHKKYKAFSYIEILIVVGMVSASSLLFVPLSLAQLSSTRVEYYTNDVNSVLFGVQQDAYSQVGGAAHGMRFNTDSYDVFVGESFATSTSSYTINMNNDVEFTDVDLTLVGTSTPTTEVVFERGFFKPNSVGTITMSDGSQTFIITINEEGLIYYETD